MATNSFGWHNCILWFAVCFLGVTGQEVELDLYGGHSREFQHIDEPIQWDTLHDVDSIRHRRAVLPTSPDVPTDDQIHEFIESYREPIEELKASFKKLLANEWVAITYRIKGFSSLKEKLVRKNYTLDKIRDTMGFRLTMATVSDVRRLQTLIHKNATSFLSVEEERCYGICVGAKDPYRADGYRRIHLLVTTNNRSKWAEVQLGTPYTSMWSDWNHEFIYKGKFANTKDDSILGYSKDLAKYLYGLDMQRDETQSCPFALKNSSANGTLPDEVYEMLHEPPNLCFFWTDIFLSQPLVLSNNSASRSTCCLHCAVGILLLIFALEHFRFFLSF